MATFDLVEGPAWVASGLEESPGRYPLRVEPAAGRLVEKLLPGVITTTTGAGNPTREGATRVGDGEERDRGGSTRRGSSSTSL